jgi:hypothetical protein
MQHQQAGSSAGFQFRFHLTLPSAIRGQLTLTT